MGVLTAEAFARLETLSEALTRAAWNGQPVFRLAVARDMALRRYHRRRALRL